MRLILDKENFNTLSINYNLGSLQKTAHFKKILYYNYLISKECFLRRHNNSIENVEIKDGIKKLVKYGDNELICDFSEIIYKPFEDYQIPTELNDVAITHTIFKLQKNSPITLHITKINNGIINDIWFEVENDFADNPMVMEDIDTFLKC